MKISIQITSDSGSHKLTATLVDNSSATAFYELLKAATRSPPHWPTILLPWRFTSCWKKALSQSK